MKQLQPNPWDTIGDRYQVGMKVRGKVRNLTDFGAFVEIEPGVDGLVHVSDISWSKKVKHPKDALKKGDDVEAIVTSIDTRGHRLSLSIKELTPSAWEAFVATHRPGDVVRGKISRFAGFGVFVELADELEGLCHISELSDERVNRAEDVVQIGQEMDFKILRIEPDVQKIGLSARAVGKEEEPEVDTKVYSTEAKGGMASLGELANLKFGRDTEEAPAKEEPKREARSEAPQTETAEVENTSAAAGQPSVEVSSETTNESAANSSETSQETEEGSAISETSDATADENQADNTAASQETQVEETSAAPSTEQNSTEASVETVQDAPEKAEESANG
jgi:ribosomal protein S1